MGTGWNSFVGSWVVSEIITDWDMGTGWNWIYKFLKIV